MAEASRTDLTVTQTEESFTSQGVRCAATIYRPCGVTGPTPVAVMAHGITLTRRQIAQHDGTPTGQIDKAITRTPRAQAQRYPMDHFGPFSPEHHHAVAADASNFLRTHLAT